MTDEAWLGTCLCGVFDSFPLVTQSQEQRYFVDQSAHTEPKILKTGREADVEVCQTLHGCPLAVKDKKAILPS